MYLFEVASPPAVTILELQLELLPTYYASPLTQHMDLPLYPMDIFWLYTSRDFTLNMMMKTLSLSFFIKSLHNIM